MSNEWMGQVAEVPQTAMEEVQGYVAELRTRMQKMVDAEAAFETAKQQYEDYAKHVVPEIFLKNGVDLIKTADGAKVEVVTKTSCSINKNDKDRNYVAQWLRDHNGADLITTELKVDNSYREILEANGVSFEAKTEMNTNKVKAWLLDQLGQKGGTAQIDVNEIPKEVHFFQWNEMEVSK